MHRLQRVAVRPVRVRASARTLRPVRAICGVASNLCHRSFATASGVRLAVAASASPAAAESAFASASASGSGSSSGPFDVVIIGAGHNGLVCAAYLAAKGLRVKVVERRSVVGGAAVTEEFAPGFRNSVASYAVSLLQRKVIDDLQLIENGLQLVARPSGHFLPLSSTDSYSTDTISDLARFSKRDAEAWPKYCAMIDSCSAVVREFMLVTPPNLPPKERGGKSKSSLWGTASGLLMGGTGGSLMASFAAGLRDASVLRKLTITQQRDVLDLFTKSAGDVLDSWFESAPVKGLLGFDAITGNFQTPYAPGSAYVLLHHSLGDVFKDKPNGTWGHAIGGMGAITQVMAKVATQRGVSIQLNAGVQRVLVERGVAKGVRLEDGTEIRADAVVSNVGPKLLYGKLIDASELDDDFVRRIKAYRCKSGTFRMNVALKELPNFSCKPGLNEPHHRASIMFSPSLQYEENAYFDAVRLGYSREPVIEMQIPSTIDPTLAPKGQHVASLFCQHFNYELPNGQHWDDVKAAAAETVLDTINKLAPNFKASIVGRQVLSPLDLERTFGLIGGDIFHGSLSLDQLYSARPQLGYAAYRGPLQGLYMCGSGTHPGGGVTGAPGHNAAQEIIADMT